MTAREIPVGDLDSLVFGWTIPAKRIFYGAPWSAGLADGHYLVPLQRGIPLHMVMFVTQ